MENFNMNRFSRLTHWTFQRERNQLLRTGLLYLVIYTLFALLVSFRVTTHQQSMSWSVVVVMSLFMAFVTGGAYQFYTMKQQNDFRELLMLPATNLEKFLARYLQSISYVVICMATMFVADEVQYLVRFIVNWPEQKYLFGMFDSNFLPTSPIWVAILLWLHTFFLLGSNVFRSSRWAFLMTSGVLVVALLLVMLVFPMHTLGTITDALLYSELALAERARAAVIVVLLLASVVHVVAAYRVFCRRQLIGKYVNC